MWLVIVTPGGNIVIARPVFKVFYYVQGGRIHKKSYRLTVPDLSSQIAMGMHDVRYRTKSKAKALRHAQMIELLNQ